MKFLKERLSRLANRQDKTRGAFFEQRFKSVGVLDEESLLAACAYIDLNPVAAGIVEVPEESPHTSVTTRVDHVKAQGRVDDLKAAERGSVAGSDASAGLEEAIWLCHVEDRRKLDSSREGVVEGVSLGNHLLPVEYTGRLFREGKSAISAGLAGILARLGTSAEGWQARLEKLKGGWLLGRFLAGSCKPYFRGSERRRLGCTTWPIWAGARRDSANKYSPLRCRFPLAKATSRRGSVIGANDARNWPMSSAHSVRSDGPRPGRPLLTAPVDRARSRLASTTRRASPVPMPCVSVPFPPAHFHA